MPHFVRYELTGYSYHVTSVTSERRPLLSAPASAQLVVDALQHIRRARCLMLAYVVMPDHFHALLVPFEDNSLSKLMQTVKGYTARMINGETRGTSVWQQSFHDRVIRNDRQLEETIRYIHDNPVVAGLCVRPEDFPFSSAYPGSSTNLISFTAG